MSFILLFTFASASPSGIPLPDCIHGHAGYAYPGPTVASYSEGLSAVKYTDISPAVHSVTAAPAITYAKSYDLGHADYSPASKFGGAYSSGIAYSKNYISPAIVKPIIAAEPVVKYSAPAYISPPVSKAYLPPPEPAYKVVATPAPTYISAPVTPAYEAPTISKAYLAPAITKSYLQPGKYYNNKKQVLLT